MSIYCVVVKTFISKLYYIHMKFNLLVSLKVNNNEISKVTGGYYNVGPSLIIIISDGQWPWPIPMNKSDISLMALNIDAYRMTINVTKNWTLPNQV